MGVVRAVCISEKKGQKSKMYIRQSWLRILV